MTSPAGPVRPRLPSRRDRYRPRIASRLFADLTPLRRSRDFRFLFGGQAVAYLGRQLTVVAAPVQVYELTGSSLAVGLLGLAQLPFLIGGSLFGGALADAATAVACCCWPTCRRWCARSGWPSTPRCRATGRCGPSSCSPRCRPGCRGSTHPPHR
ncbi:MAG: hypothetical protein R2755_26615 [Acidimicrobiales bacterium]